MHTLGKRWTFVFTVVVLIILTFHFFKSWSTPGWRPGMTSSTHPVPVNEPKFRWSELPQQYPLASVIPLPTGKSSRIPKIQHEFKRKGTPEENRVREERLQAVRKTFAHAWEGYRQHAWLKDELAPVSGSYKNRFGGWAATLVDSLDTLWIMGFKEEFDEAASAAVALIDFSTSSQEKISVFETTIRHLGGFLSAYDLSGYPVLLEKAVELGDMLYMAFDTPNRMPSTYFDLEAASQGEPQEASQWCIFADIASLSLEFTRLSQLTKDSKYFDAIQRIYDAMELGQNSTKLPGMWPMGVSARDLDFAADHSFSLGAMADSAYEYLPKQYLMLGGLKDQYRKMYEDAIDVIKEKILFRPLNKDNLDILVPGIVRIERDGPQLEPAAEHLACFAGGMVGIGAKIFSRDGDLAIAQKLVNGCVWAYSAMPSGIMAEKFTAIPCGPDDLWNETLWRQEILRHQNDIGGDAAEHIASKRLQPGITKYIDAKYILRPEAIESVFILYRITGNRSLQDTAWAMFDSITKHTATEYANAEIEDVTLDSPKKKDSMESFWTAETLKYFYLVFSEPGVASLDEYVFNTEAHPLKRPKRGGWLNFGG